MSAAEVDHAMEAEETFLMVQGEEVATGEEKKGEVPVDIEADEEIQEDDEGPEIEEEKDWHLPDEYWTTIEKMASQSSRQVKFGSISRRLIDSHGKALRVPKKDSGVVEMLEILMGSICAVSDRCDNLEAQIEALRRGSNSLNAPSVSSSGSAIAPTHSQPAKKSKATFAGATAVPRMFAPWPVGAERCDHCQNSWSQDRWIHNFSCDQDLWGGLMDKVFLDWSPGKAMAGAQCLVNPDYSHTPGRICQSLLSVELIQEEEYQQMDAKFRRHMHQPEVPQDRKPCWLMLGTGKSKYMCFGCVRCQRGTSLYYNDPNFRRSLNHFFWS